MSDKNQPQIKRTIHYRDYQNKAQISFFFKKRTHKFEIFWTPKDEDWDEHYICTYDVPTMYTIDPTFVGQPGDDGRMRILFKLHFSTIRAWVPSPDFDVELLLLPVERDDGTLHLAVVSAGSQCDDTYKDIEFVKKELDRLVAAIEGT